MRISCLILLLASWLVPLHAVDFVEGELKGQLGNQFFIIATTVSLAMDNGATPIFPDLLRREKDNTILNYKNVFFRIKTSELASKSTITYKEPRFGYEPIPYQPNMKLSGYFQSYKYFDHHRDEICNLFAPSADVMDHLFAKYDFILHHPLTVSLHIRSYWDHDPEQKVYIACTREYIEKAINHFPPEALFVVFSNNQPWCSKLLEGIEKDFYFVERDNSDHYDFFLMSRCTHNIISNSSFSWWAAYLNPNPDKVVIAPKKWFNPCYISDTQDMIPEQWLLIE